MTTSLHTRHFMSLSKAFFLILFALSFNNLSAQIVSFGTHQYEYVAAEDISWTNAKAAALARSNGCTQGYLATITSAAENNFIANLTNNRFAWIGATDAGHVNTWAWEPGGNAPENGMTFYIRTSYTTGSNVTFTTTEGTFNYSNWDAPGEPAYNSLSDNYAQIYPFSPDPGSAKWNDLPNTGNSVTNTTHPHIGGYIVEYNPCSSGGPTLGCTVCHNGRTLHISCDALKAHLGHGDQIGECPALSRTNGRVDATINNPDNIAMANLYDINGSAPGNRIMSIYPNPATNGIFTLALNNFASAKAEITITDINGREIQKKILNTTLKQQTSNFDLSKYGKGLYFIKVVTPSGIQTSRVIVQ